MDIDEDERPVLRSLRDPAVERLVRDSLRESARDGSRPLERDLARDLLSGSVSVVEALRSRVYGEVFALRLEALEREGMTPWSERSAAEQAEMRAQAAEFEDRA